jgi:hypothetical protein
VSFHRLKRRRVICGITSSPCLPSCARKGHSRVAKRITGFDPLLKFKLGHYLRNLAQLTRYGNHQAAMPYCPHDQVPPAEPDHAQRHERQPVALAQLSECHAPEFEIFIRDLEAGWKFGARGDGSRAPGFAPSEVRFPSSAGGLCQGQPLTWRRALSGPKPQRSRTPPAPPSCRKCVFISSS